MEDISNISNDNINFPLEQNSHNFFLNILGDPNLTNPLHEAAMSELQLPELDSFLQNAAPIKVEELNNQSLISNSENVSLVGGLNTNDQLTQMANSDTSFESGVFTVGESGSVTIDFLADAGQWRGELAIFNLEEMEDFGLGSFDFIREAARRALSNSELGYVVISDRIEGAQFSGILGSHERKDWNSGEYLGVKTFAMNPGDEFGFMLVPNGTVKNVFKNPRNGGAEEPLFSMGTADPDDAFDGQKMADITGDGRAFGIEEKWIISKPDRDYNDVIFQVQGATGQAVSIDEVINPAKDWRDSELGQKIIQQVVDPLDPAGNTPDEARNSLPSTSGKTYRGWVGSFDTDDYYSFSLGMSNEFNLSLDGLTANANVEVLDLDQNVVLSSTNPGTEAESISGILEHGAYRVRVFSVGDIGTAYNLNLSVTPTIEGITTEGSENPVFIGTDVSGPLINMDDFRSGAPALGSRPEFAGINGQGFSTVIIDTGIDLNHPFFGPDNNGDNVADRIVFDFDFAENDDDATDRAGGFTGHGSTVASIAASNDATFRGMAPQANIIALKIFLDSGPTPNFDTFGTAEQALQWVVVNAETFNIASVNMSFYDHQNYNTAQAREGIDDELAALAARGVITVSISGNDFFNHGSAQGVAYPGADENALSVGAVWDGANIANPATGATGPWTYYGAVDNTTGADRITAFSQRHATLTDIFAPGARITGANDTGGTDTGAGTSFAAPHVAGMAVLAQQLAQQELNRKLTPAEFRQLLRDTAVQIFDGDENGNGIVDGNEEDYGNVTPTGLNFLRADMLALAHGIMDLRPPSALKIDLSPTSFNVVQSTLKTGDNFNVNFQIQNTGLDDAGSFDVNFYLSENNVITQTDTLIDSFTVNRLAGNSNTGLLSQTFSLPAGDNPVWSGFDPNNPGFIGMIVDANNVIGETNENNNISNGDAVNFEQQGTVTLTINRVRQIDNPDENRPWGGDGDYQALMSIDDLPSWTENISLAQFRSNEIEDSDFRPNWQHSRLVSNGAGYTIPLGFIIIDVDGPDFDDLIDEVFLRYNPHTNLVTNFATGEVLGRGGQQIYRFNESSKDRAQIWYTVNYS